jgi:hypothetical protein
MQPEGAGQAPQGQAAAAAAQPAQPAQAAQAAQPDPLLVAQLVSMGFSENGSARAVAATGGSSAEAAMEWVLGHMEDAGGCGGAGAGRAWLAASRLGAALRIGMSSRVAAAQVTCMHARLPVGPS